MAREVQSQNQRTSINRDRHVRSMQYQERAVEQGRRSEQWQA
jgi:hypothetical protein